MFFAKPPKIVKANYKQLTWELPNANNEIYLTFDDGPTPEVTEWVLEVLAKYDAKATFFCLGENVVKHPNLVDQIKQGGHAIGNHSFSHPSGWKSKNEAYFNDIEQCQKLLKANIFRPPYGRITKSQAKVLSAQYQIIMWDVLSGDYSLKVNPEKCLKHVIDNTKSGSIIVFHDSEKAFNNLRFALPKAIEILLAKGFSFAKIK